jgi:hypothetical protein
MIPQISPQLILEHYFEAICTVVVHSFDAVLHEPSVDIIFSKGEIVTV